MSPGNNKSPDLQTLKQKVVDSGVLGRSPVYIRLLDYLVTCAHENRQPKEFEIAVDVLGRDSSFDVTRDSVVRVYIHQLRKRLEKYYTRIEPDAVHQLVIPKGQYTISATRVTHAESGSNTDDEQAARSVAVKPRWLLVAVIVLLLGNLGQWWLSGRPAPAESIQPVLAHPMWQAMMDDDLPVLIVMGDYYIFGELDENGRINRMVRDFFINSSQDLANLFLQDNNLQNYFRDLDMTYMPEGSANALLQIAPVVAGSGKRVGVTMMSRLRTSDLRNNHIVYIGYISAMDKLNNLYFQTSGLLPGRTFDEIYNKETQTLYSSTAGLPEQGQPFRDLALLASWPGAHGNQFVLISGTRDAGLMHAADAAANLDQLQKLDATGSTGAAEGLVSHEVLFEVYGIDRMNFEANVLYQEGLDPALIWQHSQ